MTMTGSYSEITNDDDIFNNSEENVVVSGSDVYLSGKTSCERPASLNLLPKQQLKHMQKHNVKNDARTAEKGGTLQTVQSGVSKEINSQSDSTKEASQNDEPIMTFVAEDLENKIRLSNSPTHRMSGKYIKTQDDSVTFSSHIEMGRCPFPLSGGCILRVLV